MVVTFLLSIISLMKGFLGMLYFQMGGNMCKVHSSKCAGSSTLNHCGNLGAGGTLPVCGLG